MPSSHQRNYLAIIVHKLDASWAFHLGEDQDKFILKMSAVLTFTQQGILFRLREVLFVF